MSTNERKYNRHDFSKRLKIVSKVLDEHFPVRTTARLFQVDPMQVKYWVLEDIFGDNSGKEDENDKSANDSQDKWKKDKEEGKRKN